MKRFITFAIILCLMTSCFLPLTVASSFAAAKDPAYNTSSYYKAEAEPSSADADGESSSDDADDRPGFRALGEYGVRSPLRE